MTSDARSQDGRDEDEMRRAIVDQIPDEAWDEFVSVLQTKLRDRQASQETRVEFVQMLFEKLRSDPFPSREQLDLIEQSLPPEMVAEYARTLMEKVEQEPYPSNDMLRRIRAMTQPG